MNRFFVTLVFALSFGTVSNAATIDLTDNSFTSVTYESFVQGPIGPIIAFQETESGVAFDFARISGQFRQVGPWGSGNFNTPPFFADIGGGAGSVSGFTLTASADVTLNAFLGLGQQFNINPVFDVTGTGVSSTGNTFGVSGFPASDPAGSNGFAGGPLSLVAGHTYTFAVSNAGVTTRGYLTGFDFEVVQAQVPLPAGLPLLLTGFAGFAFMRRRRS